MISSNSLIVHSFNSVSFLNNSAPLTVNAPIVLKLKGVSLLVSIFNKSHNKSSNHNGLIVSTAVQ